LEPGWSGKLWALNQGVAKAGAVAPYLWFSDADIEHGPDVLARLVEKAEQEDRGLVSLMVRLRAKTWLEKLVVPAFVFFFQKLYPFPAINNPSSRFAGAAGGCVLLKHKALQDIGGIAAIKDRLIDDCALGIAVKRAGHSIWLGHGEDSFSLRGYDDFASLSQMVTRTAFAQLGYSNILLALTVLGMAVIYLAPPFALLWALWVKAYGLAILSSAAWFLMTIAYMPTVRLYKLSPLWAIFLPITAALFEFFTLKSAFVHWQGGHTGWKGRDYASSGDKLEI
jgi:hopene-associated glycosyltransferase HpnB